jgi:hypothetical protein
MGLSRRERPAPLSAALARSRPPVTRAADEVQPFTSIARAPEGSSGSGLGAMGGVQISRDETGRAVVAFPPPPDVAARVPLTGAPMQISRQGFGGLGGMPALPDIPQAPAMPGMPQIPQGGMPALPQIPEAPAMPQLGGGGGAKGESLATSSSSDASPTDELRRQFKLDREQLGQVVDDLP